MEVNGKNRHREQVNSKVCSLCFQLIFNPNLAMVEVLSGDGIESKKKASTCHPSDDVQDCNLRWIEQFSTRQSDHSKHLQKRISSYPELPTRLKQVPIGKSTTPLGIRGYQPPAFTCVPLLSRPLLSPFALLLCFRLLCIQIENVGGRLDYWLTL